MKVGIDILENTRFKDMAKHVKKLSKIFTEREIKYFEKFYFELSHIAGAFCAKEAFVKALKTGFSPNLRPVDVEILHEESGAPYINVNEVLRNKILKENETIELSISHNKEQAIAICIIS